MSDEVKGFYVGYHDTIAKKRYDSPYWLRRYAHRRIYAQFLPHLVSGQRVLDAGCGEGVLSCLAAQRGVDVVGVDISAPNLDAARRLAAEGGTSTVFLQGDLEKMPFPDNSFDIVIASHVLEHLPDLHAGLREVHRVTRDMALIAMPTCLNPACWVLLGGDKYWKLGRRSMIALPIGIARTAVALLRGEEGPNEGYAGHEDLPHIWRFPWVMRKQIERAGFRVASFEAGPLILPYLAEYLQVVRRLQPEVDRLSMVRTSRNLGYGSMALCRKI